MNTKTGAVATVKYQAGLSIIEIMVALLLSSLLTLGLVQVFTGNSQSFRLNEANSRVQESGRIALEMLSRAVRNAGYYGCRPMNGLVNNLDTTDDDYDESLHKFDWSEGSIYSGDTDRPPNALDGTDYLRVSGMETETFDVVEDNVSNVRLIIQGEGDVTIGDILMISDCVHGDIFQITGPGAVGSRLELEDGDHVVANTGAGSPGNDFSQNNCNNCLSTDYADGARVMRPYRANYFIGQQGADRPEAALFRDNDALVSGIKDMRIQYGIGPNLTVTQWKSVGEMNNADWSRILAARISILVRSAADNVVEDPQTICFPGPTWDGQDCEDADNREVMPDRRLYRVYTTTAAVRNPTE